MRGYYSLKTLLPLFDENLNYQDLDIHQGMDAVVQWRNLDQNNDESDHQAIRDHLRQYCGLDTYSMIIVMDGLKRSWPNGKTDSNKNKRVTLEELKMRIF